MKYLVMETHPAYTVLLDEQGRYLRAANLRYQVGDTVEDIISLKEPSTATTGLRKSLAGLTAMAACLCLVFFGYYSPNYTAYGTLRIQINPDVEMTISQTERVLDLEGLNRDGEALIEGYSYRGKNRDTATVELVDRAIEMGYLSGGDTISITVDSRDTTWKMTKEERVRQQLEERYGEGVVIHLIAAEGKALSPDETSPQTEDWEVLIPVVPQTPRPSSVPLPPSPPPTPAYRDTDYGDTDYGPSADGITDYDDTDYGPNADGITDYDDTDYGPNANGITDYDDTDYGPNADGITDYDDTDYGPNANGITDYDDTDYGPNADGITDYDDTDYGPNADGITDDED